jgi:signal peptide peptidase SppA
MIPQLINKPLLATPQQISYSKGFDFVRFPRFEGKIAIIPVEGLLLHRFQGYGTSYQYIRALLSEALNSPQVEHIVLDIDSGGGEVSGLFDLVDEIVEARSKKPITALINEHAYSAAYLIASSANQIIASRTASVGSIGVIVAHVDQSEAEEKMGFKVTEIYAGKHKIDFSPHFALSDDAKLELQAQVNDTYELFTQTLSRNRNAPSENFRLTEAKIFSSNQAMPLQLIDKIQSPNKFFEEILMTEETNPADILKQERERMKAIFNLCGLAKQPECAADFIEQGTTTEEVRKILFDKLVANTQEPIINAIGESQANHNQLLQSMVQGLQK